MALIAPFIAAHPLMVEADAITKELLNAFEQDERVYESWNTDLVIVLNSFNAKENERQALFKLLAKGIADLKQALATCKSQSEHQVVVLTTALKQLRLKYIEVVKERNKFLCNLEQLNDKLAMQLAVTNGQTRDMLIEVGQGAALAEYDAQHDNTQESTIDFFDSCLDQIESDIMNTPGLIF
jgi:hypothetical protein